MMMDPLTGAKLTPPYIWQLVDDMLVAQEQWLPQYGEAIRAAKERQKGERLPLKEYVPAARLKERTLEEMAKEKEETRRLAAATDKAADARKNQ